jgi:L-2-hydroxyglutarate oxidase LhgO
VGIQALHAPEGASFDSATFVRRLLDDAAALGATCEYGVRVLSVDDSPMENRHRAAVRARTTRGTREAAGLVNCAGLHADRLAGPLAEDLRLIPFRGYYAELTPERRGLIRSHVYAAPDLEFPFLGVHISRQADGRVLIGPGAMLAFGREAYALHQVSPRDLAETLTWPGFYRFLRHARVPGLIRSEVRKSLSLRAIWDEARLLVPELRARDLVRSFAGNRAQLVTREGKLVDDILVRETERAVHVLNAVSPGLTASLPFGEHLAERVQEKLG